MEKKDKKKRLELHLYLEAQEISEKNLEHVEFARLQLNRQVNWRPSKLKSSVK
jgi:hypothetical protein